MIINEKIDYYNFIFEDLKCMGFDTKIEHFYPLLVKESANLANYLEKNANDLSKINIEDLIHFKRITSLIKLTKYKYNCYVSNDNIYQIISLLHTSSRQLIKLADIAKYFDPINVNKYLLFETCVQKLINLRVNKVKNGTNYELNEIYDDWFEIINLFDFLRIKNVDSLLIKKLTSYIENLKFMNVS